MHDDRNGRTTASHDRERGAQRHPAYKAQHEVEITVRRQSVHAFSRAIVRVRDYGPGVPNEHLEKIFLPFYRVPTIHGEQAGGAGLGLAITERIVRMYG
jgi:signal transduction histidine kinase